MCVCGDGGVLRRHGQKEKAAFLRGFLSGDGQRWIGEVARVLCMLCPDGDTSRPHIIVPSFFRMVDTLLAEVRVTMMCAYA